MSRQSLIDYLTCKSDTYENVDKLGITGAGGGDFVSLFPPICERPQRHSGYDVFGVHWTSANPSCHYTQGQDPIISDIEKWIEEVCFPKVERFDWGYVEKQAENLDGKNKVVVVTIAVGPFERTTSLTSFEDCLANAITNPEEYSALISAIADYKIDVIHHLFKHARPDVVNLHDDWGTSLNTFFRPDHWRQVIKPHTKRMYDAIREHGALVSQHSDGAIGPLIGDIVEMGVNIWEGGREIPDQIDGLRSEYRDRLCIVVPPEKPKPTHEEEEASKVIPDVKTMPLNYQPYDEVPVFLYK